MNERRKLNCTTNMTSSDVATDSPADQSDETFQNKYLFSKLERCSSEPKATSVLADLQTCLLDRTEPKTLQAIATKKRVNTQNSRSRKSWQEIYVNERLHW